MARTAGEMEEEDVSELPVAMDDDEEDDTPNDLPYNPKGLPLGWDGKVKTLSCLCPLVST